MDEPAWYEIVSMPALLRHARGTYGNAMRAALEAEGYDDIPKSGLYVIGALALGGEDVQLSAVIADIGLSKQAAGQLVDTLVTRGYLERRVDPQDRRRLVVTLTERGRAAAKVQQGARDRIDARLAARTSEQGVSALRRMLAAVIGIGRHPDEGRTADRPPPRLASATPILFVRDVRAAAEHYRERLGFAVDFLHGDPPFYGAVSRGGACLHLRHVAAPNFAELAAREGALILATIGVSDVEPLFAEAQARGAEIVQPLETHDWGGRDFQVRDPDGNRISFVQFVGRQRDDPA